MVETKVTNSTKKTALRSADFVHLHTHSHYSLLDGLQKIPEMLDRALELGMGAIALTDHGTLSGAIEFYKEAEKRGIKPLLGMETYVAPNKHTDKEGKKDANPAHLILIAMNNQGYENLMRLSTIAHLEGFYYRPRVDHELLQQYNEGLIVLSACVSGEVGEALKQNDYERAKKVAAWYQQVFGDRYYLELQDHAHEWELQKQVNEQIRRISKELKIPMVVTADAHYALEEDMEAHEALLCVQTGSQVSDQNRMSLRDMHLYLSSPEEIIERWADTPEVITNTKAIADRCELKIVFEQNLIPQFPLQKGETEAQRLELLAWQGLAVRYLGQDKQTAAKQKNLGKIKATLSQEVVERAEFELDVITNMGFASYFLIFEDFVSWGKEQGIIFGPGRGSAAGSIISFALGITDLDPIKYDLLFERFLNPERISMPDIDIDIQDNRRDEVIEYVASRYGTDRVSHIVTFGTMAARNAIRDVARVLGVSYAKADRLAKMVPPPAQGRHTPLKDHLKKEASLKEEYAGDEESKRVLDLAMRLEGTIRSHGVHAAGVVIAPDELVKYIPLELAQKGVISTQYSMKPVEDLGILKMDFLGLSNLTIIKNALRIINKVYKEDLNISEIPLDDVDTFALLGRGETVGVFQFESSGMKRYLKELQPTSFDDIVALAALFRPGPLSAGYTDAFVATKNGKRQIQYDHPKMRSALESTYGILVYQEQVMQIAKDMCGFTGGQADTLRKAIGKKIPALMKQMKSEFVEGMITHSEVGRQFAEEYWEKLEGFADYCFNKSHSACYALIAYQTAYLKAHYPAALMAALMTSNYDDTEKVALEINECRRMGLEVLPPDVNESFVEFGVVPEKTGTPSKIRFGLTAVKNVGVGAVEKILEARQDGPFKSMEDFVQRVPQTAVNRKTYESLIKAGAFDRFAGREALLFNMDLILAYGSQLQKEASRMQIGLFGADHEHAPKLSLDQAPGDTGDSERLQWERELLGVYLSEHPLSKHENMLSSRATAISHISTNYEAQKVRIGGLVTTIREITTRNGAAMCFVGLEDLSGGIEIIVFPKLFEDTRSLFTPGEALMVEGNVSSKDREGNIGSELKILAEAVYKIDDAESKNLKPIAINNSKAEASNFAPKQPAFYDRVPSPPSDRVITSITIQLPAIHDPVQLLQLKQLLRQNVGSCPVYFNIGNNKTKIKLPFSINPSVALLSELERLFEGAQLEVA